jgi:1,4-dihydroxy-2-naphthoate octaprenyltransferase
LFAASSNSDGEGRGTAASLRIAELRAFLRLGRPLFLGGGFVMYGLGAAAAVAGGARLDWTRFWWGQLIVTATQLATHYANDYFDVEADRANQTPTRWSGGSRVLLDGGLPPWIALGAALALTGIAIAAAVALGRFVPDAPSFVAIVTMMIVLAWGYSAPPARLCARGLGELTTAAVVTFLVPLLAYALQGGEAAAPRAPFLAAVALPCALQFAMLLAIEFPDAAGDAATGKRTLVVRMGGRAAARLYAGITLAGFGALPIISAGVMARGLPGPAVIAPLVLAPLACWQAIRVVRGGYRDGARWESVAFWSVALLVGSAVAELIGIVVAIRFAAG